MCVNCLSLTHNTIYFPSCGPQKNVTGPIFNSLSHFYALALLHSPSTHSIESHIFPPNLSFKTITEVTYKVKNKRWQCCKAASWILQCSLRRKRAEFYDFKPCSLLRVLGRQADNNFQKCLLQTLQICNNTCIYWVWAGKVLTFW